MSVGGLSLCLIVSVSFLTVLKFSFQRSFTSWARFAPRSVFYVVVSGIVSFLLFPMFLCVNFVSRHVYFAPIYTPFSSFSWVMRKRSRAAWLLWVFLHLASCSSKLVIYSLYDVGVCLLELFFLEFYYEGMSDFIKVRFCIYEMNVWFLSLFPFIWCINHLDRLTIPEPPE